jgi:hypothetical protein
MATARKPHLRQIVILASILITAGVSGQSPQPGRLPTIGFVKNAAAFGEGGCTLWLLTDRALTDERRVFLSNFEDRAVVNVDGRDVEMKLVGSSNAEGEAKKGRISTFRYRGTGVDVIVRYVVTGLCAPDDEQCEVVSYDAELAVMTHPGQRTLRAHGICGS